MDPIPAACEMVTALQTFVTRRFDVFDPVVITTGVFHAGTVLHDGRVVTAGGRVLSVTATAPSLDGAISRAYGAVERIHFDGMHFRRDIGTRARPLEPANRG